MPIEIERKFLVKELSFKAEAYKKSYIKQGFLNSNKERTVRIRIKDDQGYLTIKGKSNESGTSRFEWEQEILLKDAERLLTLCEKGSIEKYRYFIKSKQHIFEVDEFLGENLGLLVAEIELNNENETFTKPSWLGFEVTGDKKYYNSNLSKNPFCNWK